jgi:hypothetical protein
MRRSGSVLVLAAGGPSGLLPAREQMAVSLGWHIILACFGVAFPTMIFVMHRRGIVREDPDALRLARRWAKMSAVLFAIGAVSGTVLSFEMGLLWPTLGRHPNAVAGQRTVTGFDDLRDAEKVKYSEAEVAATLGKLDDMIARLSALRTEVDDPTVRCGSRG